MGDVVIEEIGDDGEVITPLNTLPAPVQRRVMYLKEIHGEYEQQEKEHQREMKALDQKFAAVYEKIFAKRAAVVIGEVEAPESIQVETAEIAQGTDVKGIPRFWLTAIQNCNQLTDMIQEADEDVLEYLTDVRCEDLYGTEGEEDEDEDGFKLTFEFSENPYFSNKTLTKTYHLDDDSISGTEGCNIDWKPNKNITVKVLKKKAGKSGKKGAQKSETKIEQLPSFFNFFAPPAIPEDIEFASDSLAQAIQEDFEIGECFKDDLIPEAVGYFLGEVEQEEDDDEYDEDDEDEDEDEDDDDDEEDDEDDSEEERPNRRKKYVLKDRPKVKEQPAECKQQ